jgi:type I restriction enzyme M protein
MNTLRDGDVDKVVTTFREFESIPKYANVAPLEKVRKNGYNLSVTLYVDVFEEDEAIDVGTVWKELKGLEESRRTVEEELESYLTELGYEH